MKIMRPSEFILNKIEKQQNITHKLPHRIVNNILLLSDAERDKLSKDLNRLWNDIYVNENKLYIKKLFDLYPLHPRLINNAHVFRDEKGVLKGFLNFIVEEIYTNKNKMLVTRVFTLLHPDYRGKKNIALFLHVGIIEISCF